MSQTTILADHNLVLEGSAESRERMAKMLPIALDWAHVVRVGSFDSRVAKGDFCKDYKEFCRGNLGISRTKMPQLREDVAEKFARSLAKLGIRVKKTRIPVENLKATQKEINSDKAEGIAGATVSGKFDPTKDPVIVSREGHILDGHHRWAAALVATLKDGVKRAMSVIQIDLPIRELLQRAVNFDGVAFAGFDEGNFKEKKASEWDPVEWERYLLENWLHRRGRMARFEEGKPADPTENMSEEDAREWRENTDKYRDKFKESDADDFEAAYFASGRLASVPEALRKDEERREKARTQLRAKRRSDMATVMRSLKHPSVDLNVKSIGNGLAYQVTVPNPEQLEALPAQPTPVKFVRMMLMFQNLDDPTRTGFTIQDKAEGDGVTLLDWESALDKKWRRLWTNPPSQKELDKFERMSSERQAVDGTKIRKQMDAAKEMGLTKEDIKLLVKKFPDRYRDLAVAMGVKV